MKKKLWIGGLLSLLVIAALLRFVNNPGGDNYVALTPADYVLLHETRNDGGP